jgi:nitrate/TMAO reductase-like tetraheme cytochrome c subunit
MLTVLAAWLFLMVVMAGGAAWYTSRPVFCSSCHIMEPYYKSWQESKHKDVTCIECHFPPSIGGEVRGKVLGLVQLLKYVTASAGPRPSAEIPDASCLRSGCHERRLLEGQSDFRIEPKSTSVPFTIPFDHTPHLQEGHGGKTLRCTSCHSQIVQGSHMTVTTTTCFLCHFKDQPFNEKLSRCTHCHQIPKQEFNLGGGATFTHDLLASKNGVDCKNCHADLVRGNGDVPHERCLSCHNRESDLKRIGDHEFMHQKHVTEHKVDCTQCHTPILHALDPDKLEHAAGNCQACHPDHHQEQVDLLEGKGARFLAEAGAKTQANLMVDVRVACPTCHKVRETSSTGTELVRGSTTMCAVCHDAATVQKFEVDHVALRGALPVLQAALAKAETAIKQPSDHPAGLVTEIADVRHDLDLLTRGNDIHNMHYATKVVREVKERLDAVCRELKVEGPKVSLPGPVEEKPASAHVDTMKAGPAKEGAESGARAAPFIPRSGP